MIGIGIALFLVGALVAWLAAGQIEHLGYIVAVIGVVVIVLGVIFGLLSVTVY